MKLTRLFFAIFAIMMFAAFVNSGANPPALYTEEGLPENSSWKT